MKMQFNLNTAERLELYQNQLDGRVHVFTIEDGWEEKEKMIIPPGDMVMLLNLYRFTKDIDIRDCFVNPLGSKEVFDYALEEACRQWCDFIDEAPERKTGEGFADFFREIVEQKKDTIGELIKANELPF